MAATHDYTDDGAAAPMIPEPDANTSLEDRTLLLLARLMEGGKEDEDTCQELDELTKTLTDDASDETRNPEPHQPLWKLLDSDSVETMLGYLDMRQSPTVRGHATLTTSAYLKASNQAGVDAISDFFRARVSKGTYDDLIVAFSVASSLFPVIPAVIAPLFLSEGFVASIGPLMKRRWKSRKVEQAALELLNTACMDTPCREAIRKYCTEWLDEIVHNTPKLNAPLSQPEGHYVVKEGSLQQCIHSQHVRNIAAIILTKLQVSGFSLPRRVELTDQD